MPKSTKKIKKKIKGESKMELEEEEDKCLGNK